LQRENERLIMSNYRKTIAYSSIAKLFVETLLTSNSKECLYSALDSNPQWVAFRLQRASEVFGYSSTRDAARSFHTYIRSKTNNLPLFSTLRDTTDTMTGHDMDELILSLFEARSQADAASNVTSLRAQNGN
jgi:hypothetical protein